MSTMTKRMKVLVAGAGLAAAALTTVWVLTGPALAAPKPVKVTINHIDAKGVGKSAGTITIKETKEGLELATKLKDLPPGEHGFHLHEKGTCDPADKDGTMTPGQAAGAHYDPESTKAHKGPGGGGHKGDLPKLVVGEKGAAKETLKVAGLKLEDVAGRSLMIHAGGDNYADAPQPLGGGGARIACGVIPGTAKPAPAAAAAPGTPAPAAPAKPAAPPHAH